MIEKIIDFLFPIIALVGILILIIVIGFLITGLALSFVSFVENESHLENFCLSKGYTEYRYSYTADRAYCIKTENGTDKVMPVRELEGE